MAQSRDYRCTCLRCGMIVTALGLRLSDDAVRALRKHIRQAHPGLGIPADAQAGLILARFDVEREADE